jgi:hypothetical protein
LSTDFKAIAALPIIELAQKLGWSLTPKDTKKGLQLVGNCPMSGAGGGTVFKVTPAINRFICFCPSCETLPKPGGDIIELMRRLKGIEPKDVRVAAIEVQKAFNGAGDIDPSSPAMQETSTPKSPDFDPIKYLKSLKVEHEALAGLDILPETLVDAKAGYCSQRRHQGRLAVAWIGMDDEIKGFIGVSINGDLPLYLSPKEGTPLPYWYGCHRVEKDEELRIRPTILDVLRAWEDGGENIICPVAPVRGDSLTSLKALVDTLNLTVKL